MLDRARRRSPFEGLLLPAYPGILDTRDTGPMARRIFRAPPVTAAKFGDAFGVPLPLAACRAAGAGNRHALWLGPDEWLLLWADDNIDFAAALRHALGNEPHSLVDVSHRSAGIVLEGPHVAEVLNAGCPLDLHLNAFPAGMCVRTIFGKAEMILWRTGPATFHLEAWRSFWPYILGLIAEAAAAVP